MKTFVLLALVAAAVGQNCPEEGLAYFADSQFCDRYSQCRDGVYTEEQCPDGLLFNDQITNGRYPCDYPADVDCGSRSKTQPAQPTENCPHQWGYFGSGDRAQCGYFYNCVNGEGFTFSCPEGLAFSSASYRCEWPDESPDCDSQAFLGFSCPNEVDPTQVLLYGHARLRSPRDCRQYFICVGPSPRLHYCDLGLVFNEATNSCDEPEAVQGCQNYYPPEELAAIRERKEKQRLAQLKREEEFQLLRQQLAQRTAF